MDRRDLILAALASGGENMSYAPAQLQKLIFLIDTEASNYLDGPHFNFKPYDYGPFDQTVYVEVKSLANDDLVEIFFSGMYRKYILTQEGFRLGSSILNNVPEKARTFMERCARWVSLVDFRQQISAIFDKYPHMATKSVFRKRQHDGDQH